MSGSSQQPKNSAVGMKAYREDRATGRIAPSQEQQLLIGSLRLEEAINKASNEHGSEAPCASSSQRESPVAICTLQI